MDITKVSQDIISNLGGNDNIKRLSNCMTRIRCDIIDRDNVNLNNIKQLKFVINVIDGEEIQIVVGPGKSSKITEQMKILCACKQKNEDNIENYPKLQNSNFYMFFLKKISSIFIPLVPVILTAGILNNIISMFFTQGSSDIPIWVALFQTLSDSFFIYLTIFVGISTAQEFNISPILGAMIGAINIAKYQDVLYNNINVIPNENNMISVIISVILLAYIQKKLRKIMPDIISTIFVPLISIVVVGMIHIWIMMPLFGKVSEYIVVGINFITLSDNYISIISGFILATAFLSFLKIGMHHIFSILYMVQMEQTGTTSLFPIFAMFGAGQIGSALAIYLKEKYNKEVRQDIQSTLPLSFFGLGEPMFYKVMDSRPVALLMASIGGGFGGSIITIFKVQAVAFGASGIMGLFIIVPNKIIYYLLALLVSCFAGFVLTYCSYMFSPRIKSY